MTDAHALHGSSLAPRAGVWPDNPVLVRLWRGAFCESQHRGAWVLVDTAGNVREGAGGVGHPVFARSSIKALQGLPLVESGAAAHFGYGEDELALALSSHNGEAQHTDRVESLLARLGLSVADLRCGAQPPGDPATRLELDRAGRKPTAAHNNCSGKHAGFLALARHLGEAPERYLEPDGEVQRQARAAVEAMTGVRPDELSTAVDGCSAPTFRMPLARLATAMARVANPEGLAAPRRAACERMAGAVAAWPELIAGRHKRLCTDIARATGGRLFPKIGGEAVYVVGVRGKGVGLAVKIDDGETRGLNAFVVHLLKRLGYLTPGEFDALAAWHGGELRNWAGLAVGRMEVLA